MTGETALVPETRGLQGEATVSFPFTGGHYLDLGIIPMRPIDGLRNVHAYSLLTIDTGQNLLGSAQKAMNLVLTSS